MNRCDRPFTSWLFTSAIVLSLNLCGIGGEPLLETDVLPILTKKCMSCHGGLRQKGDLDLRTMSAMLKGGKSGPAVVKGKAGESELWLLIEEGEMPKSEEKQLTKEEKRIVKDWINAGMPTYAERVGKHGDPMLPPRKKHSPLQVAQTIDKHIDQTLRRVKLEPGELSDDVEFLRRVYLDITGRVPTADEAVAFLDDAAGDKRSKLIDKLLETEAYGKQLGRTWRDWICPPELPSDMNGGKQPHTQAWALGDWFGERFTAGDTWDKIVRDLLMVSGEIKKQPQVIFYGLVGQNAKATPDGSARAISSLFMGVQLQCAQCHDDPYRDWSQQEHWAMAAFFRDFQGDFNKIDGQKPVEGEIAIPKSAFMNAGTGIQVAFLKSDKKLEPAKKAQWRPVLVDWLTNQDNPFFAKSFANRMWFYFFSRGLVTPIDDMRALNPPTHPGLLKLLENEFIASGFDIKHLIRCICNSQTYQRTSRISPKLNEQTRDAMTRQFARMPVRVMTSDMLYDSLKQAYDDSRMDLRPAGHKDGNTNGESAALGNEYLQFQRDFCTNEEDSTDFTHGIPQMLALINHPRLRSHNKALDAFLKSDPVRSPSETVEWLYLQTLSRRPTTDEKIEAGEYIAGTESEELKQRYLDVLWMLVNRSEFLLIR